MSTPSRWDQNSRVPRAPYSTFHHAGALPDQGASLRSLPSAAAADQRLKGPPFPSMTLPSNPFSNTLNTLSAPPPQMSDLPFLSQSKDAQLHSFLPLSDPKWTRDHLIGSSSSSSGAGVHRKQKFQRSRTGCLVCRERKVKCSQDGLPCKQCGIGNRNCHYDESQSKLPSKKRGSVGGSSSSNIVGRDAKRLRSQQGDAAPAQAPPNHALQGSSSFRGLNIPPLGQPAFGQPSTDQNTASHIDTFYIQAPTGDMPLHLFKSCRFVTSTYDPTAEKRYTSLGDGSDGSSTSFISAECQHGVQWSLGQLSPPLPSLYGQEDPCSVLDSRINSASSRA